MKNELEQLRKELNELRERVAVLEKQPRFDYITWKPYPEQPPTYPFIVTCGVLKT